jgi:hypothetical protein
MAEVSCLRCWIPAEHREDTGDGPVEFHRTRAGMVCRPEVGRVWVREGEHALRYFCIGQDADDESLLRLQTIASREMPPNRSLPANELRLWEAETVDLDALGRQICLRFRSIEPDWAPPQFAIFLMARAEGMPVFYVDEQDEHGWLADWEQRFDDGELEDEIELWTPHGSVYFRWTDCRELSVGEIVRDRPHWVGLTMDTDRRKPGRMRILKTFEQASTAGSSSTAPRATPSTRTSTTPSTTTAGDSTNERANPHQNGDIRPRRGDVADRGSRHPVQTLRRQRCLERSARSRRARTTLGLLRRVRAIGGHPR